MTNDVNFESSDNFEEQDDDFKVIPTEESILEENFDKGVSLVQNIEEPIVEVKEEKPAKIELTPEQLQELIQKANRVDELQEKLTKTHDGLYGRLGQLEQQLKQQGDRKPTEISPDNFASLNEYLTENFGDNSLATALANDLKAITFGGAQSAQDPEQINALRSEFETKRETDKREFEMKLVEFKHPDWKEEANTPEFAAWTQTLKPDSLEVLQNTWDGVQIIKAFDSFKDWKTKKLDFEAKKQQRLTDAIPATKGNGGKRDVEQDYFNQGVTSVLDKRKIGQ